MDNVERNVPVMNEPLSQTFRAGVFSLFRARASLANTRGLADRYLQIIF
jgi:hypothetical protein